MKTTNKPVTKQSLQSRTTKPKKLQKKPFTTTVLSNTTPILSQPPLLSNSKRTASNLRKTSQNSTPILKTKTNLIATPLYPTTSPFTTLTTPQNLHSNTSAFSFAPKRSFSTNIDEQPGPEIKPKKTTKTTKTTKKIANADVAFDLDIEAEIARIQRELAALQLETTSAITPAGDTAIEETPAKKVKKTRSKKEPKIDQTEGKKTESEQTEVEAEKTEKIETESEGVKTEAEKTEAEKTEAEKTPAKKTTAKKAKKTDNTLSPTKSPVDGITVDESSSNSVLIDALQGAKVKKNSKAAQRAKLVHAAAVATQAAVDSATNHVDHPEVITIPPPDTVVVNDVESAKKVLEILMRPDIKRRYHACDTETTGIDPKIQSPVGNGTVICASIYVGPDVDFGGGSRIWIDNYGKASGTLDLFKEYFEDLEIKKVWHNYSFDRHILYNHGINCIGFGGDTMHMARLWNSGRTSEGGNYGLESLTKDLVTEIPGKESMTTRFGHKKVLKNGDEGKLTIVPGTLELQLGETTRTEWIDYSVRDAQATWYLRERLQRELEQWPWTANLTMMDFYKRYWLPFGEMLTDMERVGIHVRRNDYLPSLRVRAEADRVECEEKFLAWARKVKPECQYMNSSSEQQKQQLFFAPVDEKDVHRSGLEMSREFECENTWGYIEPGKDKPKKNFKFSLTGLGLPVLARTPLGKPQINMQVLKELAGNPTGAKPKYGKAYDFFGGGDAGREACEAMYQLIKLAGIEITISTFIDPLTVMPDQNDRVHCSLNLNTETGRLSARKPNLQNQPSMDKDSYKIRDAFSAEAGNKLIVSDYGQLELRVLAHITKCKSMIEAFKLGGDFHSRTAMGMYKYVSEAVEKGDVLLEWDFSKGEPPKPLLKDKYGNERKKAKILNFSIAYGKTARGLAQDFGVSVQEAKETVDAWYADRPEVLEWQKRTISEARRTGVTRTLMGRYRPLHGINDARPVIRGHAERMAINTPVQGGAADLVAAAMLKLHLNEEFKQLGYKIVLQVHDELIVEGPEVNVERAFELVKECMGHPFKQDLSVDLVVDSNIANTWYEGK
jgi:DNA polymerase-1